MVVRAAAVWNAEKLERLRLLYRQLDKIAPELAAEIREVPETVKWIDYVFAGETTAEQGRRALQAAEVLKDLVVKIERAIARMERRT